MRVSVLGCQIDALTFTETVARVDELIRDGSPSQHCSVNAAKAVLMDRDHDLRDIVSSCALVNADGQSVVWASRLLGEPLPERVTGVDLFEALLGHAARRGYGVYLLGARAEVVAAAADRACRDHPGLRICGYRNGYWEAGDEEAVVDQVRETRPDLLFVAMPSPRKEYWLARHLQKLGVPFAMGVGGSFDVYAGRVKRAPLWMQRAGLEWAYRLGQEPSRMWRRYLVGNIDFARLVIRYLAGSRRMPAVMQRVVRRRRHRSG